MVVQKKQKANFWWKKLAKIIACLLKCKALTLLMYTQMFYLYAFGNTQAHKTLGL